ncbi:MAG: hypothetical protein GF411_16525 [Candidatus Lokiarchaeota archaeon]|nr:hypothetical protein [Candidatus Lokiarchaeota archaeon]
MNQVSITTTPLASLTDNPYYNLSGIVQGAKLLHEKIPTINFEFQNMAEWVQECEPRDSKTKGHRSKAWNLSKKYTVQEIADVLKEANLPILSIHANRDVGICLCSNDDTEIELGKNMVNDSFYLAESVGAKVIVFHFWDTFKQSFDIKYLKTTLDQFSKDFPSIIPSVENVPTHLEGSTPYDLASYFDAVTLDIRWAAMYDELGKFPEILDRIVNIHMRGTLGRDSYTLENAPFSFDDAMHKILDDWGYSGILTFEPEHMIKPDCFNALVQTIRRVTNL